MRTRLLINISDFESLPNCRCYVHSAGKMSQTTGTLRMSSLAPISQISIRGRSCRAICRPLGRPLCSVITVCGPKTFRTVELTLPGSRSATLSSYAGDTALPGGRWDKTDASLEDTAVSPFTTGKNLITVIDTAPAT